MMILEPKRFDDIVDYFNRVQPLTVVGDIGIDKYTQGDVSRISPEAPVAIVEVTDEWYKLGLAANVSDNLYSLGVNSTLCGIMGDDKKGDLLEELLLEKKMNIHGILRVPSRKTTFKERVTTKTQQICRIDYESVESMPHEYSDRLLDYMEQQLDFHSAIIIEDYAKGLCTEYFTPKVIDLYKRAQKIVAVDPSRTTPPEYYRGATLLKPNLKEAIMMSQYLGLHEKDIRVVAEFLMEKLKLEKIVITLGPDGMAMIDSQNSGRLEVIPTFAQEVYDVSGAGDTAISTITASLLSGATLKEAIWIGNLASSIVVGKHGTATVTVDELKQFYQKNFQPQA